VKRQPEHLLVDIVAIAILAVLSGVDNMVAIETYSTGKQPVGPMTGIRRLDLKGTIITLDAMGTQRDIAAQIRAQEGDYILAFKGNQGTLHHAVTAFFQEAERTQWANLDYSYSTATEAGHHRIEHRQVWACR
jgi:predicted transposase YbfD/YdcC